ncbi:MAG: hypothetical protein ABJE47_24620 [bacterium]
MIELDETRPAGSLGDTNCEVSPELREWLVELKRQNVSLRAQLEELEREEARYKRRVVRGWMTAVAVVVVGLAGMFAYYGFTEAGQRAVAESQREASDGRGAVLLKDAPL